VIRAGDRRLDALAEQWSNLGHEDPFWAVLTDPSKRGGRWDASEFFETGRREVDDLMTYLGELGVPANRARALDFGSGVGRLTRALARHFDRVIGVDIAESMVAEASRLASDYPNCEFVCNRRSDLAFLASRSIDLIYSDITLQHIGAPLSLSYIRELLRVMRDDGVTVFHLPVGYEWNARGIVFRFVPNFALNPVRRRYYGSTGVMEMHAVRYTRISQIAQESHCQIVDVTPSLRTGDGWDIRRFVLTRNKEPRA
jgi:SAM-dependent methyltransferase